jgi:hypothetical protein
MIDQVEWLRAQYESYRNALRDGTWIKVAMRTNVEDFIAYVESKLKSKGLFDR